MLWSSEQEIYLPQGLVSVSLSLSPLQMQPEEKLTTQRYRRIAEDHKDPLQKLSIVKSKITSGDSFFPQDLVLSLNSMLVGKKEAPSSSLTRPNPQQRLEIQLVAEKNDSQSIEGQTYDRCSIEPWLEAGNSTCPCTRQQLTSLDLVPNHTLRRLIQKWCVVHVSMGVDRIPTPIVPVDPQTVKSLLYDISQSNNRWHSLKKLKQLLRESDRNRKCIQDCGALSVLASVLSSVDSPGEQIDTCEESLAIIASFSLSVSKTTIPLLNWKVMTCIAWFQCKGSLESKVNAATILAAIATRTDLQFTVEVSLGVLDSLSKLLREDFHPKAVEASLQALLALCGSRRNLIHVVEVGVLPTLIELLPGAKKENAERALGVLALVCTTAEGRAVVADHALAMAVLVGQIHTVSMLATEYVVSILWYLCKASFESLVAAQQAGAFAPLLLLLQTDCSPKTRQKGTGLLKHIRSTVEGSCVLQHL